MKSDTMTVNEVIEYLNISRIYLYQLTKKKAIPVYKLRNFFLRYKREDVEAYKKQRELLVRV